MNASERERAWRQRADNTIGFTAMRSGRWMPEEDAFVMRNDMSLTEIGDKLRRPYAAVNSRRVFLRKLRAKAEAS